jgi:hypothetical protein
MIPRRPTPRKLVRAAPAPAGQSQTCPALLPEIPAGRNSAGRGGQSSCSLCLHPSPATGRRTFIAFLAGGLAWRAQQDRPRVFNDIHAEPWTGPLTFETVTVTVVPQHPENSSEGVAEARQEQRTVAYGETGAKGVREIRGVRRVS